MRAQSGGIFITLYMNVLQTSVVWGYFELAIKQMRTWEYVCLLILQWIAVGFREFALFLVCGLRIAFKVVKLLKLTVFKQFSSIFCINLIKIG